jgi:Domain of unknown function (DUF5664)
MIGDGGERVTDIRKTHPLGGMKDNLAKPRVELIPSRPLLAAAEVLGYGARNYAPNNWRLGMSWEDTYGSLQRHLMAWHDGEDADPASGLPHLAHALCQLMFLTEFSLTSTGEDDRWRPGDADAGPTAALSRVAQAARRYRSSEWAIRMLDDLPRLDPRWSAAVQERRDADDELSDALADLGE